MGVRYDRYPRLWAILPMNERSSEMNTDTRIFGYTDGMNVHPQEDDIVLCPSDGAKYFEANPNEWRIMRVYDQPEFIWHKCDDCQKMIFPVLVDDEPSLSDAKAPGRVEGNRLKSGADPRLVVYAKFIETLEF